ncbi:MAG: alpha-1,2-fucosyltransferase [Terracidiphilus sp.]
MKILLIQKYGLGNQLFQYAAGVFYARKYGATLEILRRHNKNNTAFGHPRPFLLSNFCISAPFRQFTKLDRLICSVSRIKRPLVILTRFATRSEVLQEPFAQHWTFLPALPVQPSTRVVYLEGYFQAYQYAQDVEDFIRTEFCFRRPPSGRNLETLERIRAAENPVSVHVRCGDYAVWLGGVRLLPSSYYARAMQTMMERISNPTFFVFSDDIAFARESLPKGERMEFVDHNNELNADEDLRLMSACRHHIIANSTFSWWGAWLNPRSTKVVCAPMIWQDDDPTTPYPDILPPAWLRIPQK